MPTSDNYLPNDIKASSTFTKTKSCLCHQLFSVIIFAVGLTGGILIGIYAYHGGPEGNKSTCTPAAVPSAQTGARAGAMPSSPSPVSTSSIRSTNVGKCGGRNPVIDTNYESSIFAPLSTKEMDDAAQAIIQHKIVKTLTPPKTLASNYIMYIYLFLPNKDEVLDHLDSGGPKPGRFAHVHVQRGAEVVPDIMEYKVGPLGTNNITVTPLTNQGDIHFNTRPYDFVETVALEKSVADDMKMLTPLINESFGGATYPGELYLFFYCGPPGIEEKDRQTRFNLAFNGFRNTIDLDLMHFLPLSGTVHNPGTNSSSWRAHSFYYLNQGPYPSAKDLLGAYNNGSIRKFKLEKGFRDTVWNRIFPDRDDTEYRDFAKIPGPRVYLPAGPRYTVRGTHVDWMGWAFDISAGQVHGPGLFDIRFKGERVIYEHSLNEIALQYGMDSAGTNSIIYTDATYGVLGGDYPNTIMRGTDCPDFATLLNTSYWFSFNQTSNYMTAICVFEADGQEPLWRHSGGAFGAGIRNNFLVVRVPVVIGNYDYTFQYEFYLDGKIFTRAIAAGYIQSYFWDPENPHRGADKSRDAFGYRVSDYAMGPVHNHMFGFKVDMDISGRQNTFQKIKWKAGNVIDALRTQTNITDLPPYFVFNETRYVEWEKLQTEEGLKEGPDQDFWLVINEQKKNKWGAERGYQIIPLATGSENLPASHPAMKPLSFNKYHCAVTKRKEEEQYLSSIYDVNRLSNPKGYFDLMLNNEPILNEDIVTWVTIGFLHVPTAEDVPMTVKVEASFLLRPFNFFDRTASFDMPQFVDTQNGQTRASEPKPMTCYEESPDEYCRFC